MAVLEYPGEETGWTDTLTELHEREAPDHYLDRASRAAALDAVRRHLTSAVPIPIVLEIGCSSGSLLRLLHTELAGAALAGADVVSGPLRRLASNLPGVPLLRFDLVNCPLPEACVDIVVLLNVLEHIADDVAALRQVRRILKPGGAAVIEVPASPGLYDDYDRALRHVRRYRLRDLIRSVREAGLVVERRSHLGFSLFLGFWLVKKFHRRRHGEAAGERFVARRIRLSGGGALPEALMRLELVLGRFVPFPFGIRCLVTCIRPD